MLGVREVSVNRSDQSSLPPLRRSVRPREGDTLTSVAERELPQLEPSEAAALLERWNPHLARLFSPMGRPLLVSDIVYLEPPPS